MGSTPRYSDDYRAGAVLLLQAAGWPHTPGALERTAGHLNIRHQTLLRWATGQQNPPPHRTVQGKRPELAELFRTELAAILEAMNTTRADASYRDLGIVAGILADKLQLLTGNATQSVHTQIRFIRDGITSLPEPAAPLAIESDPGAEAL